MKKNKPVVLAKIDQGWWDPDANFLIKDHRYPRIDWMMQIYKKDKSQNEFWLLNDTEVVTVRIRKMEDIKNRTRNPGLKIIPYRKDVKCQRN